MIELTREQAMKIRETYAQQGSGGAGISTLANRYGISNGVVHLIVRGEHRLTKGLPRLPPRGNPFNRRDAQIGATPLAGEPVMTASQGERIAASRAGTLGAVKARLRLPCPTCQAKASEPCWSTRGPYPVKLKGLHPQRRVNTKDEGAQS